MSAALTGLQQYSSVAKESSSGEREPYRERDREGEERRGGEREKRRTIGNMRSARMCLDGQTARDDGPFSATGSGGTSHIYPTNFVIIISLRQRRETGL